MLTAAVGGWLNPSEGTLIAEFTLPTVTSSGLNAFVLDVSNGTTTNAFGVFASADASAASAMTSEAVSQAAPFVPSAIQANTIERIAYAWKQDSVQLACGGTLGTEDTSATIPTGLTTISFGLRGVGSFPLFGHLRRVSYIPRRVSNAELRALSL